MPTDNRILSEGMLETERTFLTLLTAEDLPAMTDMAAEPDTFRYIRKLRIMTAPEYAQFLQVKLEQIRDKKGFHWAVWLKEATGEAHLVDAASGGGVIGEIGGTGGTIGKMGAAGQTDAAGRARRTFIGAVNLNPVAGTSMMQIGCQLKRDYWHQGFASELMKRIVDFGIKEAGLPTVYGVYEKENQASRRLLEKLGFGWLETRNEQGIEVEFYKYPAP